MTGAFQPFRCIECGGTVRMIPAAGETRQFLYGSVVEIPHDVLIPKCERCGEEWFSAADDERVDAAVRAAFLVDHARPPASAPAIRSVVVSALQGHDGSTGGG